MAQIISVFTLFIGLAVLYICGNIVYNLFFHPLHQYPGPLLFRATRLRFCYSLVKGTIPFDVLKMHQKYGDVVRITPDQLAFANPQAWKDIMGHRPAHAAEFEKSPQYYSPIEGSPVHIINANKQYHSGLRKSLAHSFSDKKIREQEPIIMRYVKLLMERLHEKSGDDKALDISAWYNFTSFDIIGDLAYGESFGCLESLGYHPWVKAFFTWARSATFLYATSHWPILQGLMLRMIPRKDKEEQVQLYFQNVEKLKRRMAVEGKRPDLIQSLLDSKEKLGLTAQNLETNSSILIAAGSETTATLLSGATFLLLTHPETLSSLTEEIRSNFKSEDEINFSTVNDLPYLKACLDEALRLYPPTPGGLPRTVPKGGAVICGKHIPEDTVVSIYQYAMNRNARLWTAPSDFHPERFLGNTEFENDAREALQPFHIGPRACLGQNLAYLEMRTILARLIWNFDLELGLKSLDWLSGQKIFDVWGKPPLLVHLTAVRRS